MSTATNHMKRSHRSERQHLVCLHQMQQFAPVNESRGPVPFTAMRQERGAHALGRKNNLVQRLSRKLASVRGQ